MLNKTEDNSAISGNALTDGNSSANDQLKGIMS